MNKISLDINKEYVCDVLVCGGGVAGFSAAVSAARQGAKVILVERGGYLGGTATRGLVGPFMTCYDSKGEKQIIKGFFEEFVQRMVHESGAIDHRLCRGGDARSGYRTAGHVGVTPFDVECFKRVSEKICIENGVKLLYNTVIMSCEVDNQRIKCVYCTDGENTVKILAKMFIDTTGSALLAHLSGAGTMRGNDDGILQTASMFFIISGVNKEALDKHMAENTQMNKRLFMDIIEKGQQTGEFPCGTMKIRIFENPDGTWTVNMAQIDGQLNELDTECVTEAQIHQREQILKIVDFLKKHIPALKDIKLVSTASDIGIRESRRMVGKTVFCLEHILKSVKFDDRIAVCANSIDIHCSKGVNYTPHDGSNYYIPLSCLISCDVKNLLTAGKSLSADKYAFAAVRVMPPCFAMGEAAGICASLAAKEDVDAENVPYKKVQSELLKRGAYLD